MATHEDIRYKVRQWSEARKHVVLYDDASSSLLDVASAKMLRISWPNVNAFEEKIHPETKGTYLVLLFDNGAQIALVEPGGVAFAPSTVNSGPVDNMPPVTCLGDFLTLKARIDHYLYEHPDDPPRECLNLVMICIAILDGARAVGFDVADMERELETALSEFEKKKG